MKNGVLAQLLVSMELPAPGLGSQSQWTFIGSDGIIESDSYGKVRLGRGDAWEEIYEMPPFGLNSDVYSPVRLEAFAAQVEAFANAVEAGGGNATPGMDGERRPRGGRGRRGRGPLVGDDALVRLPLGAA